MLNFRKLKQEFPPAILKEGRQLYEKAMITSAKIVKLTANSVRISCRVAGGFENTYQSEIEIDRRESIAIDSDCDCPYKYDCQHLAGVLFYLEEHFDSILIEYSKEANLDSSPAINEKEKETLLETIKEAETKETVRRGKKHEKELLLEYKGAAEILGQSPFFLREDEIPHDRAELTVIFTNHTQDHHRNVPEIHLALRLPYRSKPLNIPVIKDFLDAVRYREPLYIGSKRYFFLLSSFDSESACILKMIMDYARFLDTDEERNLRVAHIEAESFGAILAQAYDLVQLRPKNSLGEADSDLQAMPCLYMGSLEEPLRVATSPALLRFDLEYLSSPAPKILINPLIVVSGGETITLENARLFECAQPGMIYDQVYYRFPANIKRKHLRNLIPIRDITVPEPLFGTFVENSLPQLSHFAEIPHREVTERFVTLPFVGNLGAECDIVYLNGELEASLTFIYDEIKVPASISKVTIDSISPFITEEGVLARNLTEEQKIISDLFQDFIYDASQGIYCAKNDKKIVEFMTETIPQNQHRVKFNCPENLLNQLHKDRCGQFL